MPGFGSAWWHAPLLIAATIVMAMVVWTVDPSSARLGCESLVIVTFATVLAWRDRRIYLPRRLEAQKAGLIRRATIGWPVPTLIWCAFVAAMQLVPHRHSPTAVILVWIGLVGSACAAMWEILFPSRRTPREDVSAHPP